MKVLLDHNMPIGLIGLLEKHVVQTTRHMGWDLLQNGTLLKAAEAEAFDVLITGDKKLLRQYTKPAHSIAVIVVGNTHREVLEAHIEPLRAAIGRAVSGSLQDVPMPGTRDFLEGRARQGS